MKDLNKRNEESIEIINDLIKINHDRIKGYEKAIENTETTDVELKTLYSRMREESYDYIRELSEYVATLGGDPAGDTTVPGKIYHAWMDVKATFSGNDTKSMLSACEFGEDAAQKAYAKALENDGPLSSDAYDLIARQKSLLKGSHDLVRHFRDQYAEA
ncbi:PA2169 family four-helix-bundle protein [Chryseolinea sp. H1M3-3]|uniref:ferritin-like domain-containing protein n=1 Tax=Chryseolinea sp. H1M3-3 TaxID=3034144 RepID=UPI0023EB75E4|nr:PA2169 family four-helix-bundle protein [Chryseolinea sp. H1M3-3]